MPIVYHIDHDQRLVVATAYEVLTEAELFKYQQDAFTSPEAAGYDEILDATHVTAVGSLSGGRLADLAKLATQMDPPGSSAKFAIVAQTDFHFGLARMYQLFREGNPGSKKSVRVFRTRSEAEQWLGKSAPKGTSAKGPNG
jgi:hypothetical protein